MNYLSVDNISKAFSDKLLFENISFGIEKEINGIDGKNYVYALSEKKKPTEEK